MFDVLLFIKQAIQFQRAPENWLFGTISRPGKLLYIFIAPI
jgi:hypothetical protein